DRDRVSGAQLPRQRGKAGHGGVVIVDEDVSRSHEIEGDDEQPKQRPDPDGEKRQHGQHSGCEVAIRGNVAKSAGRLRPTTPGRRKTSPKKRKLCSVAMARCASTRSIDLSFGQTYVPKQSSHAT